MFLSYVRLWLPISACKKSLNFNCFNFMSTVCYLYFNFTNYYAIKISVNVNNNINVDTIINQLYFLSLPKMVRK